MSRPKPMQTPLTGGRRRQNTHEALDHFLEGLSPETPPGRAAEGDAAHVAGELLRRQLTEIGADATVIAARVSLALRAPTTGVAKPCWIAAAGQLWWRGVIVREFRDDAANQAAVLAAFQQAGWPPRIPDPLPRKTVTNAKRRRWWTVQALNRGMLSRTIRFASDGIGGFRWDVST